MALTTGLNDDERWVDFRYQATAGKVESVLDEVAQFAYYAENDTDVGFEALTSEEKLTLVDNFVREKLLATAKRNMKRMAIASTLINVWNEMDTIDL